MNKLTKKGIKEAMEVAREIREEENNRRAKIATVGDIEDAMEALRKEFMGDLPETL